jgi:hypothetical protein
VNAVAQRLLGGAVLLAAGLVSLPLSAWLLDAEGTENLIVPVQLVAMMAIGAAAALLLPALARGGAPSRRRALTGAWWGLLAAVVGVLVFWFALNGIHGA